MRLTRGLVRGAPSTQAAIWLLRRASAAYRALAPEERRAARALLAKSRGRPDNLTQADRRDLRNLAQKAVTAGRSR